MAPNNVSKEHVMLCLDSGYSSHMTEDPSIFTYLESHNGGNGTFGDNGKRKNHWQRNCW